MADQSITATIVSCSFKQHWPLHSRHVESQQRRAADTDEPVVLKPAATFQRLVKSSIWLAWLIFALCWEFARSLTQNTSTSTAISPSQENSMMKMTLAASAGCVVAVETDWMTSPLSPTFVIRRPLGGRALLGVKVKRHYHARVN